MSATAGLWGQSWADADDATLLEHVRAGDSEAYAELWRRHLPAAYGVAHRYRGRASAEDIVGEASLRVYDLIRAGKGPTSNFRSYFLTAVKTVAVDLARTDLRVVPSETADLEVAADAVPAYDPGARVDQQLVRTAFQRLPERDQRVLWHTAVEGTSPAVVASTMGMTANGVSVAALRARDTLRSRYLDAHADRAIERADDEECRWVLSQLGRYLRGKLPVRQRARVERHLQECRHAQAVLLELAEVNRSLPALMVPLIFVAGSATAAAWVGAAVAGGSGSGSNSAPEPTTVALAGNAAGLVAKAAALVAAGALGIGFVAAPAGGLDWFSEGGGQSQAAGVDPGSGGGGGSGSGSGSSGTDGAGGAVAAPSSSSEAVSSTATNASTGDVLAAGSSTGSGSRSSSAATTPRGTTPGSPATPAVPVPPVSGSSSSSTTTGTSATTSGSAGSSSSSGTTSTSPGSSSSSSSTSPGSSSSTSSSSTSSSSTSSSTTSTTTTTTSTTTTSTTTTTSPPPTGGSPRLTAPSAVFDGLPFLVRYLTGSAQGGTLSVSISSGVIWVSGCQGQGPAPSLTCAVDDRGSRLVLPLTTRTATVTITLTTSSGVQTTATVRVRAA